MWCVEVCEREKRNTALPLCCVEVFEREKRDTPLPLCCVEVCQKEERKGCCEVSWAAARL